jgi:hypothetical protein
MRGAQNARGCRLSNDRPRWTSNASGSRRVPGVGRRLTGCAVAVEVMQGRVAEIDRAVDSAADDDYSFGPTKEGRGNDVKRISGRRRLTGRSKVLRGVVAVFVLLAILGSHTKKGKAHSTTGTAAHAVAHAHALVLSAKRTTFFSGYQDRTLGTIRVEGVSSSHPAAV